jgi:hypothetical protein
MYVTQGSAAFDWFDYRLQVATVARRGIHDTEPGQRFGVEEAGQ